MFDIGIGWTEMMMIAFLAIIVIGPRELPKTLRAIGNLVGKARGVAREFRSSIDDMIHESEIQDIRDKANNILDVGSPASPTADVGRSDGAWPRQTGDAGQPEPDEQIDQTGTGDGAFAEALPAGPEAVDPDPAAAPEPASGAVDDDAPAKVASKA